MRRSRETAAFQRPGGPRTTLGSLTVGRSGRRTGEWARGRVLFEHLDLDGLLYIVGGKWSDVT
jgi:hypothetical protein